MEPDFPTRRILAKHIEHRTPVRSFLMRAARTLTMRPSSSQTLSDDAVAGSPDSVLLAMVLGLDSAPRKMAVAEVQGFGDPFTTQLLLKGIVPLTLSQLGSAIGALAGDNARPVRKVYVVAEGAAFQSTHPRLAMNTRVVVTWQKDTQSAPDLLLSTVTALDDPESLLQLIAWSETGGVYHFFERKKGVWAWAGNSRHALAEETRGNGPFDSHINGGLVMKELKFPWVNWNSQANTIPRELIFTPQQDADPFFARLEGAEVLEPAVRTGVRRWTRRRVEGDLSGGQLTNLRQYARQVVWTTSVNLASTGTLSSLLESVPEIALPRTFFFDEDALSDISGRLTDAGVVPAHEFAVDSALYAAAMRKLKVHVTDGQPGHSVPGDTQFAFTVPERAFEDQAVITELIEKEIISPRLAMCLLMVDFTNPVFSPDRAALLDLFPSSIASGDGGHALDAAVTAAAGQSNAPAAKELMKLWTDASLIDTVRARLADYSAAVQARLKTQEGVDDLLKLADSRNEAFAHRKLHEFAHTTSVAAAPVAHLAMRADGTLLVKSTTTGEEEK